MRTETDFNTRDTSFILALHQHRGVEVKGGKTE